VSSLQRASRVMVKTESFARGSPAGRELNMLNRFSGLVLARGRLLAKALLNGRARRRDVAHELQLGDPTWRLRHQRMACHRRQRQG
jgi:hypothetical protein